MGLCELCKKAQATFHLTNISRDGTKVEQHLCDACATEKGLLHSPKTTIDLNELLENFIAGGKGAAAELSHIVCDQCGLSYIEFRNQGLLGCANDYTVFKDQLGRLLERTHSGGDVHTGKTPKSIGVVRKPHVDIRRLKRQLDEAVAAEDYERAAELRDKIHALEKE
jgi:protein arginine kinase activator